MTSVNSTSNTSAASSGTRVATSNESDGTKVACGSVGRTLEALVGREPSAQTEARATVTDALGGEPRCAGFGPAATPAIRSEAQREREREIMGLSPGSGSRTSRIPR